jgi:hypothetical protein
MIEFLLSESGLRESTHAPVRGGCPLRRLSQGYAQPEGEFLTGPDHFLKKSVGARLHARVRAREMRVQARETRVQGGDRRTRVGEVRFRDVFGSVHARKRRRSRATAIVRDRNMRVQAREMHLSAMHAPVSVSYACVQAGEMHFSAMHAPASPMRIRVRPRKMRV